MCREHTCSDVCLPSPHLYSEPEKLPLCLSRWDPSPGRFPRCTAMFVFDGSLNLVPREPSLLYLLSVCVCAYACVCVSLHLTALLNHREKKMPTYLDKNQSKSDEHFRSPDTAVEKWKDQYHPLLALLKLLCRCTWWNGRRTIVVMQKQKHRGVTTVRFFHSKSR